METSISTDEVAGILPVPENVRIEAGMSPYIHELHRNQTHHFLARMQGTRRPIHPVSNDDECKHFCFIMSESEYNDPTSGPKWPLIVSSWNAYADSLGEKAPIAYK